MPLQGCYKSTHRLSIRFVDVFFPPVLKNWIENAKKEERKGNPAMCRDVALVLLTWIIWFCSFLLPSFFLPSVKGESASSVYESLIGSMEARWEANPLERERIYAPRRGANGAGKGFSSLLKVDYEQRWSFKFRFPYFAFKVVPDKPVLGRVDRFG